jgi:hypothetical protein
VKQNVTKLILSVARGGTRIEIAFGFIMFLTFSPKKKLLTQSKFLFLFFCRKKITFPLSLSLYPFAISIFALSPLKNFFCDITFTFFVFFVSLFGVGAPSFNVCCIE